MWNFGIKCIQKSFTAYTKILKIYMGFYDTHSRPFEDFLPMDAVSNTRLITKIIDLIKLERYLRVISYDLQKTSPNYQIVLFVSFTYCMDELLVQIPSLLRHLSQVLIMLYSKQTLFVPMM